MDRLTEKQRTAISKMSDERLRLRLVQAGYQEDVVSQLDRQTMMQTLATYQADQEEQAQAAAVKEESAGLHTGTSGCKVSRREAVIFGRRTFSDGRTALEGRIRVEGETEPG